MGISKTKMGPGQIPLVGLVLILSFFLSSPSLAFTVNAVNLSFGTIIADPGNPDRIEIDARFGPAASVKTSMGFSVILVPGNNGIIRITSPVPMACTLGFPSSIALDCGGETMVVDNFSTLSKTRGSTSGGTFDLYIGGCLNMKKGQAPGAYTGNAVITVNIE